MVVSIDRKERTHKVPAFRWKEDVGKLKKWTWLTYIPQSLWIKQPLFGYAGLLLLSIW